MAEQPQTITTSIHQQHHFRQQQQQQQQQQSNNGLSNTVKIEMDSVPNGNGAALSENTLATHASATNREFEFDFLPYIYEVIKSVEREPVQDSVGKSRESQDTSAKVLELEKKLNEARQQILLLPGIEHSREEQLRQLELCRQQVQLKHQLIFKYRNSCSFNLSD